MANRRSRMDRTMARKSASREPASRSMAALTVSLVVSGPGVNSSLFVVMSEVLPFIGITVEDVRQHEPAGGGVGGSLPDAFAADIGGVDHDVLDCIGSDFSRVFAQDDKIRQLAR